MALAILVRLFETCLPLMILIWSVTDGNQSYVNPNDATNASLPSYFPDMIQYIVQKTGTLVLSP